MRRALVPLSLALAILASGCAAGRPSSAKFAGDEKKIADQVEKIQSAGESRDAKSLCDDVLAAALRDRLKSGGSTCAAELDKALKDVDDYSLDVESVAIDGNTATAKVKGRIGDGHPVRTITLAREGADWRVTGVGG